MNMEFLNKYAALRNLNLGQAEKDYYQNLILFILYGKASKELVFKGGTALSRCYGLNRFSEDLDFTAAKELDFIGWVAKGLDGFGIRHTAKEMPGLEGGSKHRVKVEGPLYSGSEKTLCSVTLDFSYREKVMKEPGIVTIGYHMDVIPVFEVFAMGEDEIFAEKIRAMMSRESARDLYDLVFLLRKGVDAEKALIDGKLGFYGMEYDGKKLLSRAAGLRRIWDGELRSLVRHVPPFNECLAEIRKWAERS